MGSFVGGLVVIVPLGGCRSDEDHSVQHQHTGSAPDDDGVIILTEPPVPDPEAVAVDANMIDEPMPGPVEPKPALGLENFERHVELAAAVVVARCTSATPRLDPTFGDVVTDASFEIAQSLKGDTSADVTTTIPGGALAERVTVSPHSARYLAGSSYVLFLYNGDSGLVLRQDYTNSATIGTTSVTYDGVSISFDEVRNSLPNFQDPTGSQ